MASFIARPFTCADPIHEESLGVAAGWVADNLRSDIIRPVMAQHGLIHIDPEQWYPTQMLLDILRELYELPEGIEALVAIGKRSAEAYDFGPEVVSFEDAVTAFNAAHHAVHRGIDPEQGFLINKPDDHTLVITNNTPWPGELIFGILWTFGSRFNPGAGVRIMPLPADASGRAVFRASWNG